MGELIRFRPRQGARPVAPASATAETGSMGGAQILLFLGVRYERHQDDSATPEKTPVRRASRRKRA